MIAIALLFVRMLCDCFKSRRRLETEILVLRHQLNMLHVRRVGCICVGPAEPCSDWLDRCCPRILDAITIVRPLPKFMGNCLNCQMVARCRLYMTLCRMRPLRLARASG